MRIAGICCVSNGFHCISSVVLQNHASQRVYQPDIRADIVLSLFISTYILPNPLKVYGRTSFLPAFYSVLWDICL
jgi:hypothetical protein